MNVMDLIPTLVKAGVDGNKKQFEAAALMIAKKAKKDYPEVAEKVANLLANGMYTTRSLSAFPLPVDKETRYSLVDLEEPMELPDPILDEYTWTQLQDFIKERTMLSEFLESNITPPNGLLLCGQPGVGKTYIAHWLSWKLRIPLITLDLATSISSYLGRSGQNIRSIFDYAKNQPAILLLDEIDAIAKRRDDSGDLGELKRLVNVLLKEIEDYPVTGIIIGATNHPELLDKAIWRRFDRTLTINMPSQTERVCLLHRHLSDLYNSIDEDVFDYMAAISNGMNSADICKLCEHIRRQRLLCPEKNAEIICIAEIMKTSAIEDKNQKKLLCCQLKKKFPNLTQRDISQITRISLASVSRYLAADGKEQK